MLTGQPADGRFEDRRGLISVRREVDVEVAMRIALMYFFIQFVLVMTAMSLALLRAQPDVPVWGFARAGRWIGRIASRKKMKTIFRKGTNEQSPQS